MKTVRKLGMILWIGALIWIGGCLSPNVAPEAHFVAIPTSGESPLFVSFDASMSFDPDGTILDYRWAFGDGDEGVGVTTAHTYTATTAHEYTVELTVVDDDGARATAAQTIFVTVSVPHPPALYCVEFIWPFHYDADGDDAVNLNDEYFTLRNNCGRSMDLTGWEVSDEGGHVFEFPAGFTLAPGAWVMIFTGSGTNTSTELYWGSTEPIWNDDSDIAVLRDATGDIVNLYAYYSC
jgi:PKD repeat protein